MNDFFIQYGTGAIHNYAHRGTAEVVKNKTSLIKRAKKTTRDIKIIREQAVSATYQENTKI